MKMRRTDAGRPAGASRDRRGVAKPSPAAHAPDIPAQSILDALPAHAAVLSREGRILAVNAAWRCFADQNGMSGTDHGVGDNYLSVCDAAATIDDSATRAALGIRGVLSGDIAEFVHEYACDGPTQRRWFRMRVRGLPGGRDARALVLHLEVTDTQTLRARLESHETRLMEITDHIGDVLFLVDVESARFLYVSRAYEEVWQRPRTTLEADLWAWLETVHPDDRQAALELFGKGLSEGHYALQYRILWPDGSVRWLESRGWPVHDEGGRFVRLAGVTKDITERRQAARALEVSQRRFAGIVESAMDAILTVDAAQRIVICNPAAESMFGYTATELVGSPLDVLLPKDARVEHARLIARFGREFAELPASRRHRPMSPDRQVMGVRKSGALFPVEVAISMDDSTGEPLYTAILRDQSERVAAQERILYLSRIHAMLSGVNLLMLRERDTARLFDKACRIAVEAGGFSMALITLLDDHGKLELAGAAGGQAELRPEIERILRTGRVDQTLATQAIREKRCIISNDAKADPRVMLAPFVEAGGVGSVAVFPLVVGTEAVGAMVLYAALANFFHDEERVLLGQLSDDIAFGIDHINKERKLHQLAYYDPVTGLANRALFLERVEARLRSEPAAAGDHAIFVADIERFRHINEALGRAAGDEVLRMVGGWILQHVVNADNVARIGADEFALHVPWVRDSRHSEVMLRQRIRDFHEHPFDLQGKVFRLGASVGGALSVGGIGDAETLLRRAETALREATTRGERLLFFSDGMQDSAAERLAMENALRRAAEEKQFVLHFQPKRDLATHAITGAEALIRWNDPQEGLVAPGKFIPLLEQTGLIREVGQWALSQALETRRQWQRKVQVVPKIAVNVSAVQLRDAEFLTSLRRLVADDPTASGGLELEITESIMMEDVRHTIAVLEEVRSLGIGISIDDFGTGFSSLSYLARLPVDCLKIDGSFIHEMLVGPEGLSLVSTIINLAHSLRLKVVAEGVETEEQARLLRLLGCDQMQGYLLGKAVPEIEFVQRFLQPPADGRVVT